MAITYNTLYSGLIDFTDTAVASGMPWACDLQTELEYNQELIDEELLFRQYVNQYLAADSGGNDNQFEVSISGTMLAQWGRFEGKPGTTVSGMVLAKCGLYGEVYAPSRICFTSTPTLVDPGVSWSGLEVTLSGNAYYWDEFALTAEGNSTYDWQGVEFLPDVGRGETFYVQMWGQSTETTMSGVADIKMISLWEEKQRK